MPTDPAALADEFIDEIEEINTPAYLGKMLYPHREQIAAALRQYADPRTALALRLLEIVENPTRHRITAIDNAIDTGTTPDVFAVFLALAKGETP